MTGAPDRVLETLRAVADARVDSIALAPIGPRPDEQLRLLAQSILPAFASR